MITKKEDLINTAVFCANGDLRDLYINKCKQFGIFWEHNLDINKYQLSRVDVVGVMHGVVTGIDNCYKSAKRLTISDLKPRTKVGYEKVEFDPEEIWKAFKEHQEVGFLYVKTSDGFECLFDGVFNLAMAISQGDQLYRKVERQVEWWEDAVDYIRSLNGEANAIDFTDASSDGKKMAMNISVVLDERQARDFARILLEQEDENQNDASS